MQIKLTLTTFLSCASLFAAGSSSHTPEVNALENTVHSINGNMIKFTTPDDKEPFQAKSFSQGNADDHLVRTTKAEFKFSNGVLSSNNPEFDFSFRQTNGIYRPTLHRVSTDFDKMDYLTRHRAP